MLKVIGGMRRAIVDMFRIFADPELRGLMLFAAAIIAVGVVFYMLAEGWDIAQAFYFCVTTLTTVGYGDLYPTTDFSRLFTTGYVIIGVGFMLSFVTVVARQATQRVMPYFATPPEQDDKAKNSQK